MRVARVRLIPLLTLTLALAGAASAAAQRPTLSSPNAMLTWSGGFEDTYTPAPEGCALGACREYRFDVDLPNGVWSRPGGLQVAIEWRNTDFDLDLYVYGPRGEIVAEGKSLHFAQGQSVRIDAAPNGSYRALVVPDSISPFASIGDVRFNGVVGVRYAPAASPDRDLLPDLVALRPTNLRLQTGTAVPGSPYAAVQHSVLSDPPSCYPQETELGLPSDSRRCLRFDQGMGNLGEGPLEIRQPTQSAPEGRGVQRIFSSRGGHRDQPLSGGSEFHHGHGHFHYPALAQSRLYASNRKHVVRVGKKNGFCLTDVRNLWFGRQGGDPRAYAFPGACDLRPDPETLLVMGMSPGWADVYSWYLPDQYIDVTGLEAGEYVLELEVNVDGSVVEADAGNNRASVRLDLTEDSVTVR